MIPLNSDTAWAVAFGIACGIGASVATARRQALRAGRREPREPRARRVTPFGQHPDEHRAQRCVDILTVLIFCLGAALFAAGLIR